MKKEKDPSYFDLAANTPARNGGKQTSAFLRRNANEIRRYRVTRKIILISIAILFAFLMVLYGFALIYDRTGRFTVQVNGHGDQRITLCSNELFIDTTETLIYETNNGEKGESIGLTDICGLRDIPENVYEHQGGDHSNSNFFAYTFFCKNLSDTPCGMQYEMNYSNVEHGMDECVRVRIYASVAETGYFDYKDYAKRTPSGDMDVECDKAFANNYDTVCYELLNNVPGQGIVKFTILIWIEGDDKECKDSVINGMMKFSMKITAVDAEQFG